MCGESYVSTPGNYRTVIFPYAFCLVGIDQSHQVYKSDHLNWFTRCRRVLQHVVKRASTTFTGYTKGKELLSESVADYSRFCNPQEIFGDEGGFIQFKWWKLKQEAEIFFKANQKPFEIEDVMSILRLCTDSHPRPLGGTGSIVEKAMTLGEAYFHDRAKWLFLTMLLNLDWNWKRFSLLPPKFEKLLESEYCIIG